MALSTPWKPRMRALGVVVLVGAVVLTAVALVPVQRVIWDGGFDDVEYQLRFIDQSGRPVPGVSLQVLTQAGGVCHLYPVNEFMPDAAPTSDADGRMVFHHASHGIEFSGHERETLVGIRFGDTKAPRYVCAFRLGDREVHRVPYQGLRQRSFEEKLPTVTLTWPTPEWPAREYMAHADDWDAHRRRLFDLNGDGKLDREEAVAMGYSERAAMRRVELHRGKQDITFAVVEWTVSVSVP